MLMRSRALHPGTRVCSFCYQTKCESLRRLCDTKTPTDWPTSAASPPATPDVPTTRHGRRVTRRSIHNHRCRLRGFSGGVAAAGLGLGRSLAAGTQTQSTAIVCRDPGIEYLLGYLHPQVARPPV
ncbi:unnamed protein product [Arctogadus glacialis]